MPTHYQGTRKEKTALDAFIKFTRAGHALESRLLARGGMGSLTPSQFGVLETLYHLGPLCQGALSQKLLTSTGNMTMVLDNLERRGLVRRVRSADDRRMVLIELTNDGAELIAATLPNQIAAIVEEFSVLSPVEQLELGRLCKKLGLGKEQLLPLLAHLEAERE